MALSYLDSFFGPAVIRYSGVDLPKRPAIEILGAGATAADDPTNQRTQITIGAPSTLIGDGSGFSNITGELNNISNAKVVAHEYNISATTAVAATPTVLKTIATATSKTYSVRGIVAVANANATAYGEWEINCYVVANNLGVVTILGTAVTQKVNVTGFALTFTVSGTNLIVTGTDPSGFRRWTGAIYVAERTF